MLPNGNPYLDEFTAAQTDTQRSVRSFRFGPDGTKAESPDFMTRRELCAKYAWAVPNEEALRCLADLSPVIEIGAGTGYWAALLRKRGAMIHAYDIASIYEGNPYHPGAQEWLPVLAGGEGVAARYPRDATLFLCWPTPGLTAACLPGFAGRHVALIADPAAGADAHEAIRDWQLARTVPIPQWPGFHDELRIYRR